MANTGTDYGKVLEALNKKVDIKTLEKFSTSGGGINTSSGISVLSPFEAPFDGIIFFTSGKGSHAIKALKNNKTYMSYSADNDYNYQTIIQNTFPFQKGDIITFSGVTVQGCFPFNEVIVERELLNDN